KLDYNALEPGKDATDAIRQAATDLNFADQYKARVRLTGPVPIANEEYSTVQEGAILNGIVTVLIVLVILWMALHSAKIIFAVFVNLFIGLSLTTAVGLMMVWQLKLLHPPGESEPVGYAFLAPVDEFLERHRVIIVVGTLLLVVAGLPLLYFMKFDFNPINLRNPKAESIATFLDLRKDPNTGANAINVLTNSEAEAKKIEARLEKLPEVLRVMSIDSFVPEDQPAKLQLIAKAARVVGPALNPDSVDAAPTDEENVEALKR